MKRMKSIVAAILLYAGSAFALDPKTLESDWQYNIGYASKPVSLDGLMLLLV